MPTLATALLKTAEAHGRRPAVLDAEGSWNWAEHVARVARAAGLLHRLGVKPGNRFAVLSRNSFRCAEIMHAGTWLGAVPVPVNIRLAAPEIAFILRDADCRALVFDYHLTALAMAPQLAQWRENTLCLAPRGARHDHADYETLLRESAPVKPFPAKPGDDAILLYTGGTTGRPKGVRLSHRNILANAAQIAKCLRPTANDVYLHVAPMFHSADLLATAFALAGAAHVYMAQFTPAGLLDVLDRYRVTATMLAPTMIILTLQDDIPETADLSHLRMLFYGSSPIAAEWIRRTMAAFPAAGLFQGYGLTETSPILTVLEADDHRRGTDGGDGHLLASAGRAVDRVSLAIIDDAGRPCGPGQAGEIVARGPNVSPGYLNRPDENERAFAGDWFHTGDIGRLDAAGYLYILDRKKDMIITGGENVYSSEVEAVLYRHPGVDECAVVGVPDEEYGEALFAAIVPAAGFDLDKEEIIAHCRSHIGGYKIPRRMAFMDDLPKSAMGKILKTELRRQYGKKQRATA